MLTFSMMVMLISLSTGPATDGLSWLDTAPMEVPEVYAKPGRGGCHIQFGGAFVDHRSTLIPPVAGGLQFVARRQVKVSGPTLAREVVRISIGEGPGCCGGGDLEPIREIASEPFQTGNGELINDVRPVPIPLAPGEYTVSIAVELYESRDGSGLRWHPGAVATRRFLVY